MIRFRRSSDPTTSREVVHKLWIFSWRGAVAVVFLLAWQFVPDVSSIRSQAHWLDPFFISSPSRVYHEFTLLIVGDTKDGLPAVWPYLWHTVEATLIGTAAGVAIGMLLGVILSNNETLSEIFNIYVAALNAVPRIALIPIVILIVGANITASVVTAILIVTFVAFFNAYAGGRNVPIPMIQHARLLGASPLQIMLRVRLPNVFLWTFAALPNAIAFGLLASVFAEVMTGADGMGKLIVESTTLVDSSLAFAVVVILGAVGIILVEIAESLQRRILHWA